MIMICSTSGKQCEALYVAKPPNVTCREFEGQVLSMQSRIFSCSTLFPMIYLSPRRSANARLANEAAFIEERYVLELQIAGGFCGRVRQWMRLVNKNRAGRPEVRKVVI
jgi:hypothetical protein